MYTADIYDPRSDRSEHIYHEILLIGGKNSRPEKNCHDTDTKLAFLNTPTFPAVFSPPTYFIFNPAFILRLLLRFTFLFFYLAFIYSSIIKNYLFAVNDVTIQWLPALFFFGARIWLGIILGRF